MTELMEQLVQWHEDNEHQKIIRTIEAMPQKESEVVGLLARAYNNVGRYKDAMEQLEKIAEVSREDAMWHYRIGYSYMHLRQFNKAIEAFTRAAELSPADSIIMEDIPGFIAQAKAMRKDVKKF